MLGVALVSWATIYPTPGANGKLQLKYVNDANGFVCEDGTTTLGDVMSTYSGLVTELVLEGDFTNEDMKDNGTIDNFILGVASTTGVELNLAGCTALISKFKSVSDAGSESGESSSSVFSIFEYEVPDMTFSHVDVVKEYVYTYKGKVVDSSREILNDNDGKGYYYKTTLLDGKEITDQTNWIYQAFNNGQATNVIWNEDHTYCTFDLYGSPHTLALNARIYVQRTEHWVYKNDHTIVVAEKDVKKQSDTAGYILHGSGGTQIGFQKSIDIIKSISFPVSDNFTYIPEKLFEEADLLQSAYLPSNIVAIGNRAFGKASNFTTINFPDNLEAMGGDVFKETKIASALMANTKLDKIRYFAFQDCSQLAEVSFPSTITEIQTQAFIRCPLIETVDLSECHDLKMIAQQAFSTCTALTTVKVCSHPKVIKGELSGGEGLGAFFHCTNIKTVEVVGCQGTIMTECICENRAFDVNRTYHQTASASAVEECARLIYPTGMAFDQAVKSAPNDYTSSYDWFVGNYKEGIHITQEDLQCYWKDVPLSGTGSAKIIDFDENGNKTGEHFENVNLPKYAGNGWLEFLNVGSTVPIIPDPKGRFLRTYSRTEGTGPALLPIGGNAINAYRVLDYKSTVPQDEDDIAGYLVLKKLEAVVNGTNYSYVPEETGVVLYSNFSFESAILSLAPYDGWQELQKQKVEGQENLTKLDQLLPKFKNTGAAYYDPNVSVDGKVNRLDANMLEGSYGNPAHMAPVFPWNWDTSSYGSPDKIKYRNFILSTKADSPADNPVYQWRRSKPGYLRDNRAYAQLPKSRFIYDDEQSSQMPLLEETENKLNSDDSGETQSMNVGFFFEGEEATGIITIDSKGNLVEDDAWYTLQGVKVAHPTKGVYIHNQKKVILK